MKVDTEWNSIKAMVCLQQSSPHCCGGHIDFANANNKGPTNMTSMTLQNVSGGLLCN